MKVSRTFAAAILAAAATVAIVAQTKSQPQDEEYAKLVKEWTTQPEFMSPLVDHLPKVPGIPTAKDVLGYYGGAPKKLTHVADLGRYYGRWPPRPSASKSSRSAPPMKAASAW